MSGWKTVATLSASLWLAAGVGAAERVWSGLDRGSWAIFSDSSPEEALTLEGFPTGSDFGSPALSPDGTRVAVEVAGQGIGVCALANGSCRRLDGLPGTAARPAWNPRTGEVVFALYRVDAEGEDADLWVVDPGLESPEPLVVQGGNQDDPAVSPDGRLLVYSSSQTLRMQRAALRVVSHLWQMDLLTGEPRLLSAGAFRDLHPVFSPDGESLAFASDRSGRFEVWVMRLAGGELRQVTSGEGAKTSPAWSPDGGKLLFTWWRQGSYVVASVEAGATRSDRFDLLAPGGGRQGRDADWR